jgi:hypothetical protein
MLSSIVRCLVVSSVLGACTYAAHPQFPLLLPIAPAPAGPAPTAPGLLQMWRSAGYIFQGTVVSIVDMVPKTPQDVAVVKVSFRVVQGVRGVRTGQTFTIREWAGLWNGRERYQPGERVVLFLYSPSRLGLTSPVGGHAGRFAVDAEGQMMLNEAQRGLVFGAPVVRPPVRLPAHLPATKFFKLLEGEARY